MFPSLLEEPASRPGSVQDRLSASQSEKNEIVSSKRQQQKVQN